MANDDYTRLAEDTIVSYINDGKTPEIDEYDSELRDDRAGVFVSIKKNGNLRGCIGTIEATTNSIAEEIVQNAISASTRDPRFNAITSDELDDLKVSVDVLGKAEQIDSLELLDPKRYGVIVSNGNRRGLLLPDLEGVDTPEEQIAIAMQKAGIYPQEPIVLERFEVIRHE